MHRSAPGYVSEGQNNVQVGRTRLQTVTHVDRDRWNRKLVLSHLFTFFLLVSFPPSLPDLGCHLVNCSFLPHSMLHTMMVWNWEQSKSFLSYWLRSYNRDKMANTLRNNSSWKLFVGKKSCNQGFHIFHGEYRNKRAKVENIKNTPQINVLLLT